MMSQSTTGCESHHRYDRKHVERSFFSDQGLSLEGVNLFDLSNAQIAIAKMTQVAASASVQYYAKIVFQTGPSYNVCLIRAVLL